MKVVTVASDANHPGLLQLKRLINNHTGSKPVILHGNGGAVVHMKNIYEMI